MADHTFTDEDFDFIVGHGATHLILATGERVTHEGTFPADVEGPVLISGQVKLGEFTTVCEAPEGETLLSTNHRWLGISRDERLCLYDLADQGKEGFVFFPEEGTSEWSIHPEGTMVATWNDGEVKLLLPDEKELNRATFPVSEGRALNDHQTFSACGRYLWLAVAPPGEDHSLLLLEVPSLKILDRIDAPSDPSDSQEKDRPTWIEGELHLWPQKNVLAATRAAGTTFHTLTFHEPHRRKIRTLPQQIHEAESEHPAYYGITFHPKHDRLACWGDLDDILEFSWPECEASDHQLFPTDFGLVENEDRGLMDPFGYCGDLLLFHGGRDVFDSGTLIWRGSLPSFVEEFLPNGMLTRSENGLLKVMKMKLKPKLIPAVMMHDVKEDCFPDVWQKKRGKWVSIRDQVCWVDTPFSERAED